VAIGQYLEEYFRMSWPSSFKFEITDKIEALGSSPLPVAVFHGLNQNCKDKTMVDFVSYLTQSLNQYVVCVEIGNGAATSWLTSMTNQCTEACQKIEANANFANGFNAIGLSQGSLIARYLVQNCANTKVHTLVTIAGPNMGVSQLPKCMSGTACMLFN